MIDIRGKPLLSHIAETYNQAGIKKLVVVRGYMKHAVDVPGLDYVDNDRHESTGELVSLKHALDHLGDTGTDMVVSYGDVLFNKYILSLLEEPGEDFVVTVDADWVNSRNAGREADWAVCSHPNSRDTFSTNVSLKRLGDDIQEASIHGEWMGFLKVSAKGFSIIKTALDELLSNREQQQFKMPDLINMLIEDGNTIRVIYTTGHWLDIDTVEDLVVAGNFNA
jgi:phosphoenolpyruvate phosphomutase